MWAEPSGTGLPARLLLACGQGRQLVRSGVGKPGLAGRYRFGQYAKEGQFSAGRLVAYCARQHPRRTERVGLGELKRVLFGKSLGLA
jgi:hypothetical protein